LQLSTRASLEHIGSQLDRGIFPSVNNGGIVAPSDSTISSTVGEEKFNDNEGSSRAGSRAGGPPRPGPVGSWPPAAGAWPAGRAAPLVNAVLKPYPQEELDAVHRAYPGSTVWQEDDGLWLLTESALLQVLVHLRISGEKRLARALKTDRPRIMNALFQALFRR
jgi:hypothetical protein